jgi:Amt family ammonium transporter
MSTILQETDFQPSALIKNATLVEPGFASTSFIIVCSALVMIMTPGVGLLYSGMSRTKNALSILMTCCLAYSVIALQWALWGHSLAFSETGGRIIGDLAHIGLRGLGSSSLPLTAPQIPSSLFSLFQMQFSALTAAVLFGSVVERIRIIPSMVFIFIWATLIYDPIAYWTWGYNGWLKNLSCLGSETACGVGVLDYAGGNAVEICSGVSALAFCLVIGKRKYHSHEPFQAHNMLNVFLGTALLWFGWIGFNAGSAVGATPRAGISALNTILSAAAGSVSWVLIDYVRTQKLSGLGFCSGVLAGLVAITPACGFVEPWAAIVIGFFGGIVSNYGCRFKEMLGFDDALDAFGIHGIVGFYGNIATGFLASKGIAAMDGSVIAGGAIDGNWIQVWYQLAGSLACLGYSFFGTLTIAYIVDKIPGLRLRFTEEEELAGGDLQEMGENAYEMVHHTFADLHKRKAKQVTQETLEIV